MRGEHDLFAQALDGRTGSSPHARGALVLGLRGVRHLGIIPACAGSTSSGPYARPFRWDHPRMRGEHEFEPMPDVEALGSSPHARGARQPGSRYPRYTGIIPACAGSTGRTSAAGRARTDHPRMRGEHSG